MEYEAIENEVKKYLTEKRFNHSVLVAKKAEELALKYGENPKIAKILGIAHDIAKEIKEADYFKYLKKYNIAIDGIEWKNPRLLHAKVGADMCREKFGFNERMQNVIKYHTTGHKDMDNMAKIIYIADKIEDSRDYEGVELAREKANISLDEAMVFLLVRGIKKSLDKNKLVHPNSVNVYNRLMEEKY